MVWGRQAAVAAAASALVLSGCTVVVQAPPVASPTTSATDTPSPAPTSASPTPSESPTEALPALGPEGYGDLALGMTKAQARGTGLVTGVVGTKGRCGASNDGRITGADLGDDLSGKLFFSYTTGKLVIIGAISGVTTPEGVGLGTPTAQVRAAYPGWKGNRKDSFGVDYVQAPGNPKAYYRIGVRDQEVVELTIQSLDQDCAE